MEVILRHLPLFGHEVARAALDSVMPHAGWYSSFWR